jgi:hypothetical protein
MSEGGVGLSQPVRRLFGDTILLILAGLAVVAFMLGLILVFDRHPRMFAVSLMSLVSGVAVLKMQWVVLVRSAIRRIAILVLAAYHVVFSCVLSCMARAGVFDEIAGLGWKSGIIVGVYLGLVGMTYPLLVSHLEGSMPGR